MIEFSSKWESKEIAGKALFFVCPEIDGELLKSFPGNIDPQRILLSAYLILGHTAKRLTVANEMIQKAVAVPSIVMQSCQNFSDVKPSIEYYLFLILKAAVLYDRLLEQNAITPNELLTSTKALFPLTSFKTTSRSSNDEFGMDQQCLWVVSEWFYAYHFEEGIDYCVQLAKAALKTDSEQSIRLFGSIWWEITVDLLPSAIDGLKQKRTPEAQKARAIAIGRILRICTHTQNWSQMVQNWAKLGCVSYARDVRGDVGSWTRAATLSCMNDLLSPFKVEFCSQQWTGYANVGTICEEEPLNEFDPLSLGSCLFPDGKFWGLEAETRRASLDSDTIDCFAELALKQLMEQHTKIRQLAAELLFKLDRSTPFIQFIVALVPSELQNSSLACMPSLMKCLIHAVKHREVRSILLRGLIYTVGGNTPTVTEMMSKELIEVISDESITREVFAELVQILKEEASAHRNGFYPALRTLILCCESVDLTTVLDASLQLSLSTLIPKLAAWQTKNKNTAVMKSLLDLYTLLLPLWKPESRAISLALPFLEYPNAAIRTEAAQVLYMHLSMSGVEPEAQNILESGGFGSNDFKLAVDRLRPFCSYSVCTTNNSMKSEAFLSEPRSFYFELPFHSSH